MNLFDLRTVFRREAQDNAAEQLWSNAELTEFANDAVLEAVRRAKLILDADTAEICEIAYAASEPIIELDTRIIEIREVIISGQALPLDPVYLADMPASWRSATTATPYWYIRDWGTNKIRLHQPPLAAGTLLLSVYREPLKAMVENDDKPEIPARYHRSLVEWMLYRAYSKQDSEMNDPNKAAKSEAKFIAEFGQRASARNERWASEQSAGFPPTLA